MWDEKEREEDVMMHMVTVDGTMRVAANYLLKSGLLEVGLDKDVPDNALGPITSNARDLL